MRLVWLALTAIHAPILAMVTVDVMTGAAPARLVSWLALLLATIVFALLAWRGVAPCLGNPRQNFWLLCLVTAIVHRGAIGLAPTEQMLPAVVIATTAVLGEGLRRPGRRLLETLRSLAAASVRSIHRLAVAGLILPAARCLVRLRLTRTGPPRAPPLALAARA